MRTDTLQLALKSYAYDHSHVMIYVLLFVDRVSFAPPNMTVQQFDLKYISFRDFVRSFCREMSEKGD
jgi:hypothetical protein